MARKDILQLTKEIVGYTTSVSDDSWTASYIPMALDYLNQVTNQTLSFTTATTPSLSKQTDEIITAHMAAYMADNVYNVMRMDAETGLPENKHWTIAHNLLEKLYGIRQPDGSIVLPSQVEEQNAAFDWGRADGELETEEEKDGLAHITHRKAKFPSYSSSQYGDPDSRTS